MVLLFSLEEANQEVSSACWAGEECRGSREGEKERVRWAVKAGRWEKDILLIGKWTMD